MTERRRTLAYYDSLGDLFQWPRIDSTRAATFTGVYPQAEEALNILAMRQYNVYEAGHCRR